MLQTQSSDFIGTDPIHKLLIRFATPSIIASFINCIYNIVDRLYIGRGVGTDAQAGLALTFPIMIILGGFGMMVGIGSSSVISLMLGEKKQDEAEKVLGQALALFLLFVISIQALALIFLDKLLVFFGGTAQAIPYAHEYLSIILWGNLFQHISFGMSALVRAEGNSYKAMFIIMLGAFLNIVLDPIFIFKFNMGIAGAAWATILSMFCSSMWIMIHFGFRRGVLKLRLNHIRVYPALFWRVISIGIAPCMMQLVHCAIVIIYNHSCKHFADSEIHANLGIAAYGIANTVMMCMLMLPFGVMQGMQPIVGYNYGAKIYSRVSLAYRMSMKWATILCFAMAAIMFIFPRQIVSCFSKDEAFIEVCMYVLRAASIGFTFIAPGMLTSNYFQSIGKAILALFFSMTRQVIFLIPVLIVLPRMIGFNGIWWSGPVSDTLGGLLALGMFWYEIRKLAAMDKKLKATEAKA